MIALLLQGASSMDHCDSRRVKLHLLGYVHPCPRRSFGKWDGEAPEKLRTHVTNFSIWPHNSLGEVESAMVRQHPLNFFSR